MKRLWLRLWLTIFGAIVILLVATELPSALLSQFLPDDNESILIVADIVSGLFFLLLFTALLARYLAQPLVSLSRAAHRVAGGDLSARAEDSSLWHGGEVNRLLDDFNLMASSLERLETERLATTAAIAHELRTPLAVLHARLAALRDGVFELDVTELPLLISQTQLLTRLVEDLRHLSLADAGKLELDLKPCDLAGLVKTVAASFESRARENGVRLEVCTEAAILHADAARLRQVITNLLDNALKFTPAGGCVSMIVKAQETNVSLSVQDTGPGLDKTLQARAFERFYHPDTEASGSGLGLAIVKSLVDLHGGNVTLGNAPEGGAVFRVVLPKTSQAYG